MVRKVIGGLIALGLVLPALVMVGGSASAAGTTFTLDLSQNAAFSLLGYDCGGINEQSYATGFDPTSGYPTGDVYLSTTCSGSGRGGHSTTHTVWASVTWDFTSAVVTDALLTGAPTVDPTFSAYDANQNQVYNAGGRAYLTYGPGFAPAPRITAISATEGPTAGGTTVTITGTGLTLVDHVYFGSVEGTISSITGDTSIVAVSPVSSAGTVYVTVHSPGGTSAAASNLQFTFVAPPTLTGLSPASGGINGGTYVTITGTNLSTVTMVKFGDTPAGFIAGGDTSITAISPGDGNPDTVAVSVVTVGGTTPATPADVFTYGNNSCTGSCTSSVTCARVTGTVSGTMKLSRCTPASKTNRLATAVALGGSTLTWSTSGQTTVGSLSSSSPGQGACRLHSTELDISGVVTGGTSTYTATGDVVSASLCESRTGKLSLVTGTQYSL
ncbi:MAG TPA: IPT/TIG domain-containing protein [Acidimicrobiales bacterium]|nr:IPT/TIG domain-containing protein [Acidimicrobiales bacterium]